MTTIRTIDAHAGGAPFRLVVEGMPVPAGRTLQQKLRALRKEQDGIRRLLMREPRGHLDLAGAVLTEPVTPGADAGVIFMHASDFAPLCGHGLLVVATVALERGLLHLGDRQDALVFDTAVGPVAVEVERAPSSGVDRPLRIVSAAFVGPPSFVWRAGVRVGFAGRQVPVDVAFGGEFYAVVDAEAAGVALDVAHLPELRRAGPTLIEAVEAACPVAHPLDPTISGLAGVIFTGPPSREAAALRNATIFADQAVDRSPGGTGTCAVMAILDAMGLLSEDDDFVNESLIGATFRGRIAGRTAVGDRSAILPRVEGSAFIIGDHVFTLDESDPFQDGYAF